MGPRIPRRPRPPTAEELGRKTLRRRKFGASGDEHLIPKAYSSSQIVPAAETHVSIREVIGAVGTSNYQNLEAALGTGGIAQLAAKLRAKNLPVSEWGERWEEVRKEAYGGVRARPEKPAGVEKPSASATPKKSGPVPGPARIHKREPIELKDLRSIAKGPEVDGLVAALGAEETAKLLKRLKTRGRSPSMAVRDHIAGIAKLAKTGMNAKTIWMRQDLWRFNR